MVINVENVFLGIDTSIPCSLIINELISNSLKHAFPVGKKGEIQVVLRPNKNKTFTLIVRDNGVGFPENIDFRNTQSLGLKLVNTLVNQLDGTIELRSNGGTEFLITFMELKYRERK
jgi:two-component sensor histidine kinase